MNLSLSCCQSFFNYTGRIQWATLQYATLPLINNILKAICVYPLSPLYNTQEKFQLQNDKNERKWVEHGFQNDKIDLWSCFVPLISKYSTVFHHKLNLVFKMGKNSYFLSKISSLFFRAMSSIWNSVLNVQPIQSFVKFKNSDRKWLWWFLWITSKSKVRVTWVYIMEKCKIISHIWTRDQIFGQNYVQWWSYERGLLTVKVIFDEVQFQTKKSNSQFGEYQFLGLKFLDLSLLNPFEILSDVISSPKPIASDKFDHFYNNGE